MTRTVPTGAIFWMDPDSGPTMTDGQHSQGNIVVAQITLPEAHDATLTLSAQGRTDGESRNIDGVDEGNWGEFDVVFEMPPGAHAPTPATVDCQGNWGEYSQCSTSCGGGTKERSYTVTQDVAQGGQACPSDSPQSQNCNMAACRPQVESERNAATPIVTQILTSRENPNLPGELSIC